MAVLQPGLLTLTIERAADLKEMGMVPLKSHRHSPYCIVRVGGQMSRTQAAVEGGLNPRWDEALRFFCQGESTVVVEVQDEGGDHIGAATFSLTQVREAGTDRLQVPVWSHRRLPTNRNTLKRHGTLSVALAWQPAAPTPSTAAANGAPSPCPYGEVAAAAGAAAAGASGSGSGSGQGAAPFGSMPSWIQAHGAGNAAASGSTPSPAHPGHAVAPGPWSGSESGSGSGSLLYPPPAPFHAYFPLPSHAHPAAGGCGLPQASADLPAHWLSGSPGADPSRYPSIVPV
ncbi:hypothetical protein HYH03_013763 [Edaphochlamys debaryana]|uniref:C2 domain-containing protein n=1 Tax=Edaphochlamys debaryana TaxID=47281 RepID=A0A835XXQ8_9CHLO|nr:hypothetical protein HYH03_013763 [Edaphochlamys debaryana]|eukprot:KAG2487624.1 hypothetical protein HYH03_013763 [Edaphochlamys debaryana]